MTTKRCICVTKPYPGCPIHGTKIPGPIDLRMAEFPNGTTVTHPLGDITYTMHEGFWISRNPKSNWEAARLGLRMTDPKLANEIDILARSNRGAL